MTFDKDDLTKTKKQVLAEFEKYRVYNGNLERLANIMNKKYKCHFRDFYSDKNCPVSGHNAIVSNSDYDLHKLPLEFRNKCGCLTLATCGAKIAGAYFSSDYYQLNTGWNYLMDIPRKDLQDAPKTVLNKFIKYIVDWQDNYSDKDKADKIWLEFENFCVEKLHAIIRH